MKQLKTDLITFIFSVLTASQFNFEPRFLLGQPLMYLLSAVLGGYWFWNYLGRPGLNFLTRWQLLLMIAVSSAMVLSIYWPNLQAGWGVIDDHEIMSYLGTDGVLPLNEIPHFLSEGEASKPGTALRYRPVYQTLRLVETAIWNGNPHGWYLDRLLIFIFFLVVILYIVRSWTGFFAASLFTFYIFSFDFWRDVFARLGPSEAYTVLGLGIFLFFFNQLWKTLPTQFPNKWRLLGLTLGTILAVGSKENMLVLVIPIGVLIGRSLYFKRIQLASVLNYGLMLGFILFIGWAVVAATGKAGQDVYAHSTGAQSRLQVLILSFKTQQAKQMLLVIGGILLMFIYSFLKKADKILLKTLGLMVCLLSSLLAFFSSQFVFYNGSWPDHSRYDFPGVLYQPFFYLVLILGLFWIFRWAKLPPALKNGFRWGILVGVCCVIVMRGFVSVQVAVKDNARRTQQYTQYIHKVADQLKSQPTAPVVIESFNVWDYEPIYSYHVFLNAQGVTNPFYLRLHGYTSQTVSAGLEQSLAKELESISAQGNTVYVPLRQLDPKAPCFSLFLSGTSETSCQKIQ